MFRFVPGGGSVFLKQHQRGDVCSECSGLLLELPRGRGRVIEPSYSVSLLFLFSFIFRKGEEQWNNI